jgi:HTH-type transcriptional regulator, sugar sensing transcriptional regulator
MNSKLLEEIGLTNGESRVYLALTYLGISSVGPIINKSSVSRSKIYDVLNRLIVKGLVTTIIEGKIKKFNSVSPNQLIKIIDKEKLDLKKKENLLNNLIPVLNSIKPKPKTQAEILNGPKGITSFFDMAVLENPKKHEIMFLGYPKEASIYFNAYFRDYYKMLNKKKIFGRVIYYYETWFLKNRNKRKYVKQRYMKKGVTTPTFIVIFGDYVGNIIFTPEQKLCIMIKNKEVAKNYKNYFEIAWKQSIKTGK